MSFKPPKEKKLDIFQKLIRSAFFFTKNSSISFPSKLPKRTPGFCKDMIKYQIEDNDPKWSRTLLNEHPTKDKQVAKPDRKRAAV